jgi:hypothetical protein
MAMGMTRMPQFGAARPGVARPGMLAGMRQSGPTSGGTRFEDLIRARSQQGGMRGPAQAPQGPMGAMPMQAPAPSPSASPGRVAGMAGQMGALFSDEKSKTRIRELEGIKERYEALIDTPAEYPEGFERVGAHEFSYKPEFRDRPGAGRGRFAGPMTSELKGIPGVVEDGPDGMERVRPERLTMANASQIGKLTRDGAMTRAELDALRERLGALQDDPDEVLREAQGRR